MTIDLKAIRQAAEAATPGPWEAAGPSFGAPLPKYLNCVGWVTEDDEFEDVCAAPLGSDGGNSADMAFIATANPATVIAMCDEIERLTACLKKANDQAEHFEREWYLRGDRLEAAEKDAARYRWMRSPITSYKQVTAMVNAVDSLCEEQMDAAIDAAMGEQT